MNYEDYPTDWIYSIVKRLRSGEDVDFEIRCVIVRMLLEMNYSVNELVLLFENVPDYDPIMTYHQIEHIKNDILKP